MKRTSTEILCASLLILLFAYTAFSKLFSPTTFITSLRQMPLIAPGAAVAAWLVPLTELAIVLLLFFPSTLLCGFYAAFALQQDG